MQDDAAAAREVLGLPDEVEPVAFTPLGYPADAPGPKKRKPLGADKEDKKKGGKKG